MRWIYNKVKHLEAEKGEKTAGIIFYSDCHGKISTILFSSKEATKEAVKLALLASSSDEDFAYVIGEIEEYDPEY